MPTFAITLKKTIVVELEVDDEATARAMATDPDDSFDGAWERAESEVIDVEVQ